MKEKLVSVVIPSYNRAHLLSKTIPTYIQEDVGEVIIVDDCSLDDTKEVVSRLQNKYPEIKYFRMLKNSKQTAAKNEGKKHAKYPYIYFGDDDSFILPGTIHRLLETMDIYSADVVGAKALYLNNKQEYTHLNKFVFDNSRPITSIEYELNIKRMFFINFNFDVDTPIRVPFCQACALVKTVVGQQFNFDTRYKGNAFREETDYFTQISAAGYKIFYDSKGVQINLPRNFISGQYQKLFWKVRGSFYEFINTYKYFKKNISYIQRYYQISDSYNSLWFGYLKDALAVKTKKFFKYILKKQN